MIQVINGKRYNTETATEVFSWWNGYSRSDSHFLSKTLYRTKNGAWFMHREGGALTEMAVSVGSNNTGGSQDIEVLTADDAYEFCEEHSGSDKEALEAIEKYFADRVVDA